MVTKDKAAFQPHNPLLLHWDGKLLPAIDGSKETVDRVAILVSGHGIERLLAVAKIQSGTGEAQASACLHAMDDWQLKKVVRGLVFDTTSSNTGLYSGACTLIEEAVDYPLVWIGCRHHIFEVMLSNVFKAVLEPTGGPDVKLFTRFQKQWPLVNKATFLRGSDVLFGSENEKRARDKMCQYYVSAISSMQPRDDYLELLNLCHVFLGGSSGNTVNFRAPGAHHHARWMAKAIYCLKIYMFQEQFRLTSSEKKGITDISLFVSLIYAKYWNEASLAERAPLNDATMLGEIQDYPNRVVADAATKAFRRHLWYFSEHLVGLALFDPRVECSVKRDMVQNFHRPPLQKVVKRLDGKTFNHQSPLDTFVTQRTAELFDLLMTDGTERAASFLSKDPETWTDDPVFVEMQQLAREMKVVNDCAERGIALIKEYNSTITKDEKQKQYLLRLVELHRKNFLTASKATVMQMEHD
jgi:hypothetical protein